MSDFFFLRWFCISHNNLTFPGKVKCRIFPQWYATNLTCPRLMSWNCVLPSLPTVMLTHKQTPHLFPKWKLLLGCHATHEICLNKWKIQQDNLGVHHPLLCLHDCPPQDGVCMTVAYMKDVMGLEPNSSSWLCWELNRCSTGNCNAGKSEFESRRMRPHCVEGVNIKTSCIIDRVFMCIHKMPLEIFHWGIYSSMPARHSLHLLEIITARSQSSYSHGWRRGGVGLLFQLLRMSPALPYSSHPRQRILKCPL